MKARHILPVLFLVGVFGVAVAGGQELAQVDERHSHQAQVGEIPNWAAPATWSPARSEEGLTTMGAVTSPLPFIGLTPCRIVDTRGNGAPIQGGKFTANEIRTWTITGICGLPASAVAVSLNITVTGTDSNPFGFVSVWPGGTPEPTVSTLNWSTGGVTESNAAIVPLGISPAGSIALQTGNAGANVIVDTNGYYGPAGVGTGNTFLGLTAGNFAMTGDFNTGLGLNALESNTTGNSNTAVGAEALSNNTGGSQNTAVGVSALLQNTSGSQNTAVGESALSNNNIGEFNTAIGQNALVLNTSGTHNTGLGFSALLNNTMGYANTGVGAGALGQNTTGNQNTAIGQSALSGNTMGFWNTAVGGNALMSNTTANANTALGWDALINATGAVNIGIGFSAGANLTTGSNNICIGNSGVAGESGTIRIGAVEAQTATFIAGINGTGVAGVPVLVSGSGQLGVASSSRLVKEDIREIAEESDGLMKLRPVAFKYKPQIDPTGLTQYGLIAEEVADVYPDLVAYDRDGRPETVRYHLVNALLLNEVQKQHRTAEAQEKTIEQQKAEIDVLKARLSRIEERLLADSRP